VPFSQVPPPVVPPAELLMLLPLVSALEAPPLPMPPVVEFGPVVPDGLPPAVFPPAPSVPTPVELMPTEDPVVEPTLPELELLACAELLALELELALVLVVPTVEVVLAVTVVLLWVPPLSAPFEESPSLAASLLHAETNAQKASMAPLRTCRTRWVVVKSLVGQRTETSVFRAQFAFAWGMSIVSCPASIHFMFAFGESRKLSPRASFKIPPSK